MFTKLIILAIILLVIGVNFVLHADKTLDTKIFPGAAWLKAQLIPDSPFPLQAKAGIVIDRASGNILYARNPDKQLPIASLAKLMAALVADYQEDLFYKMLVWSDNNAAEKLVSDSKILNQKAQELGMFNTKFADSSGLDPGNISNAKDLVILAKEILKRPDLIKILQTREYKDIKNTNELLELPGVIAGKTGFTDEAGECLLLITDKLISIVLNAENRFVESEKLIKLLEE